MELTDIVKYSIDLIIIPLGVFIWWGFNKHVVRMDDMHRRLSDNERDIAVIESQMLNIKEDISEIKYGINNMLILLRK
jgi:hypothetical protein